MSADLTKKAADLAKEATENWERAIAQRDSANALISAIAAKHPRIFLGAKMDDKRNLH